MNRFIRHKELYELLFLLDNKFNIDIEDYFKLPVADRIELVDWIVEYFIPIIKKDNNSLNVILIGFDIAIEEAVFKEEYEKASLFNDALKKFRELTFLIK